MIGYLCDFFIILPRIRPGTDSQTRDRQSDPGQTVKPGTIPGKPGQMATLWRSVNKYIDYVEYADDKFFYVLTWLSIKVTKTLIIKKFCT